MNKKCDKCKKESIWQDYTGKNLCATHFEEQIEKRIRKNIRINKLINIKKGYFLENNEENKHKLTEYFLKKILGERIILTNDESAQKILSNTLDDEAQSLLNEFMNSKEDLEEKIKPLSVITDDEAKTMGQIINIDLNLKPKNHSELTKQDPQLLFSINKSKEFLDKRR